MGTGSFPGVKCGRGVLLTTHPLLVPRSWKSRAIPVPTLWATTGPVTGLLYLYFYFHIICNAFSTVIFLYFTFITDATEIGFFRRRVIKVSRWNRKRRQALCELLIVSRVPFCALNYLKGNGCHTLALRGEETVNDVLQEAFRSTFHDKCKASVSESFTIS
jgi:hypothetical protein